MSFRRTVVRSASVLGQAHTPHRRFLPFAAIAFLLFAALAVGAAHASRGSALGARDTQLPAHARAAVLSLYSLDQRFVTAKSRLDALRTQTATLRSEQMRLARQLAVARRGVVVAQSRLGARLRLLYEQGNVEPLEIVFGAKSLDEALSSLDNLSLATSQGTALVRQLKAARSNILLSRHALAVHGAELGQATAEARSEAMALTETRAARHAFISSLASERRLNHAEIDSLIAEARAARLRSERIAQAHTPQAAPAALQPSVHGRTITVTATGYSLGGRTASGLRAGWGIVAVDPSVIPLGTHMTIPGYGKAVAGDTGGSVVGAKVDLWFPTVLRAHAWGRRTVTIVIH